MPTYQLLTDRTLAQSSAITPTTLIHIVYTGDPSQNIAGSSYKAELQQLSSLFSGSTFTGGTVNGLTANTISATTYLNVPVPTLNQVLVEGNETLGENIILNDMDTMINSGGTIGIQYKTGNTMYQYVTDNIYKTSRLQMDSNGFYLDNFNYDDGWYQQIFVDSSATELNIKSGYIGADLFSRTIYQPGAIGHYVGDSGATNYLRVSHNNNNYIITKVASSIEVNKFSIVNDVATYYGTKFNINNYLSASTIYATTISGDSYFIKSVGSGTPLINLGLDNTGRVVTGTTGGGTFTGGTVSGPANFTNGLSANTISATTYFNLPYLGALTANTNTINFTGQTIYYNSTTPTTGNILNDLTNAKLGLVQKIYHNDVTEPTYPAGWVLLGDAIYFTSTLNIIYAEWAGGTRVEYWYVQEQ